MNTFYIVLIILAAIVTLWFVSYFLIASFYMKVSLMAIERAKEIYDEEEKKQ